MPLASGRNHFRFDQRPGREVHARRHLPLFGGADDGIDVRVGGVRERGDDQVEADLGRRPYLLTHVAAHVHEHRSQNLVPRDQRVERATKRADVERSFDEK